MRTTIAVIICTLLTAACASSQTTRGTATAADEQRSHAHETGSQNGDGIEATDACPMQIAGATVAAEEVEGGAALRFTTTGDVAQLRQRVRRMAEMHSRRHAGGGQHGHGQPGMMMGAVMMQAETRAEDIDGGARLIFTARDPNQLAELREQVQHRAGRMASSGQCPMMAGMSSRSGQMGMGSMCPMRVSGTTVSSEDVEGGVALRFVTTGDAAELQRRVAQMAEMHQRRGGMMQREASPSETEAEGSPQRGRMQGHGMHGQHHGEMMGMMGMMGGAMMQAQVRAENIDNGARLVFTPHDAGMLAELREQVRMRAEKMSSGQCPMMSMHGKAEMSETPTGEDDGE